MLLAQTPQDLVERGLYERLAIPFMSGKDFRKVSYTLLAKHIGARKKFKWVGRFEFAIKRRTKQAPAASFEHHNSVESTSCAT